MHLKKLLSLSLIATSLLTVAACNKREVVPVEVPTTETVVETVKPAEPIVVSVEPINEAKEDKIDVEALIAFPADSDVDYYGKDEVSQPKPATPNSGSPVVDEPNVLPSVPEDHLTAEAEALYGGLRDVGEVYKGGTW
ncbi:MAG: hypothetical protein IKR39_13205 [Lachnospiraceae bacterium]|nr:hypothetical protein [Lachnospiraceae bacterium]